MLQNNCRIEKFDGFKFYEKDILHDDYVFTHDIQVDVDVTYITPGFGIALIDTGSYSIKDKPDAYLFKIGYREASIYFSSARGLELIKQVSCPEIMLVKERTHFILKKSGKKISVYLDDDLILEEYINSSLDKYNIGYYSNAGNIINSINIAANIPNNWVVNMKNTDGGYIRFAEDAFELIDCVNNAEIEQCNIVLKPGTYYVKNVRTSINDKCDIKYYVYESTDDRYFDETKNLLTNDSFTLYKETSVNFKITGTNGKISDVIISTDKDSDYIPTSLNSINFDGSYMDILIGEFEKITWEGVVSKTPYSKITIDNPIKYGLILDNSVAITPEFAGILLNKKYEYEFNVKTSIFSIKDGEEIIFSQRLINLTNKITIFKNLSAIIMKLTFYKKNDEIIDIVTQDEEIKSVNANVTSPIMVVDDYNLPLDLSSSYRLCKYNDYERYIFTNWEREYFLPSKTLKLEKSVIEQQDSMFIYGIRKGAKFDLSNIYNVEEDKINSIDLLTKDYDFIKESDLLLFDKKKSIIYLKNSQIDKYDMFIIDYLKNDSYCINFNYLKYIYEINISSLNNTKVLYDSFSIINNSKEYTQTNNYKITNLNGNINGYIVLTQGDE